MGLIILVSLHTTDLALERCCSSQLLIDATWYCCHRLLNLIFARIRIWYFECVPFGRLLLHWIDSVKQGCWLVWLVHYICFNSYGAAFVCLSVQFREQAPSPFWVWVGFHRHPDLNWSCLQFLRVATAFHSHEHIGKTYQFLKSKWLLWIPFSILEADFLRSDFGTFATSFCGISYCRVAVLFQQKHLLLVFNYLSNNCKMQTSFSCSFSPMIGSFVMTLTTTPNPFRSSRKYDPDFASLLRVCWRGSHSQHF